MHRDLHLVSTLLVLSLLCLASCIPQGTSAPPPPLTLVPFLTSTRSPSQTPAGLVAAETPVASPTPFTYTVQRGDTMGSIALKFSVALADLQAANPEISPNAMSIGSVIRIPSNPANPSGEPTPTPAPFSVQQIECYPTADKGMECFVLIHNDFSEFMENVSAQVTLMDGNKKPLASQIALLPLNILPPDVSLPLAVFFPPELPWDAKPAVQVLTAIRLLPNDPRYLPASISNTLVLINSDGRTARVNGQVSLPDDAKAATLVWVAGTAYDEAGVVVGVRRWESNAGLSPGGTLPFEFMVFSLGGRIGRVEFAVEARP
jgi:hypothetical protein